MGPLPEVSWGVPQEFEMELIASHTTPFERQVSEAVYINYNEAVIKMNRKSDLIVKPYLD